MFKLLLLSLASVVITGCATSASNTAMSISGVDVPVKLSSELKGQVNIRNVTGGKDTNPLWKSQVDNQGFRSALEQSLSAVGYKSQNGATAKYQVDALLQGLDQPVMGLTFDVKSTVLYTVTADKTQKFFPVSAVGTATTSDAFIGSERMKIANERAMKENIKQFLQNISNQINK